MTWEAFIWTLSSTVQTKLITLQFWYTLFSSSVLYTPALEQEPMSQGFWQFWLTLLWSSILYILYICEVDGARPKYGKSQNLARRLSILSRPLLDRCSVFVMWLTSRLKKLSYFYINIRHFTYMHINNHINKVGMDYFLFANAILSVLVFAR